MKIFTGENYISVRKGWLPASGRRKFSFRSVTAASTGWPDQASENEAVPWHGGPCPADRNFALDVLNAAESGEV